MLAWSHLPDPSSEPRSASRFVIVWNSLFPWPVNCMVTIGWPFWSKSARVPESFRSLPVISGIGFFG